MPVIPSDIVITQSFFKPFHISDIFLKKKTAVEGGIKAHFTGEDTGQHVCVTHVSKMFFAHDIRLKSLSVTALQMCGAETSS